MGVKVKKAKEFPKVVRWGSNNFFRFFLAAKKEVEAVIFNRFKLRNCFTHAYHVS